MNTVTAINSYINSLPESKRDEMQTLHDHFMQLLPETKLWFEDGKNSDNKTVANPNIGYGAFTIKYANGTTREFFQIGLSANTTGISVYILGLPDKIYLAKAYGETIGKAKVTGYCINFKTLKNINIDVLSDAVLYGVSASAK